jgi:hypothetical protein
VLSARMAGMMVLRFMDMASPGVYRGQRPDVAVRRAVGQICPLGAYDHYQSITFDKVSPSVNFFETKTCVPPFIFG